MKETIYKGLLLSLLLTNIWCVIAFFIYFFENPGWFHGWHTLFLYIESCWITAGLGAIVLLFSFLKRWRSPTLKTFLLVLVSGLNSFFSILLLPVIFFELIRAEALFEGFLIANLLVAIGAILAIRRINKKQNQLIDEQLL